MTEDKADELVREFTKAIKKEKAAGYLIIILTGENMHISADMGAEEMLEIMNDFKKDIKEQIYGEGKIKQ